MSKRLMASEMMAYSTVRLEAENADAEVATGTGFFYRFLEGDDRHVPAIVTNRHVLADRARARFHLTLRSGDEPEPGSHLEIVMDQLQSRWIGHPDPTCDLAAIPIAPLITEAEKVGKLFFFISLEKSLLPTNEDLEELGALEDVVMVGYPNGIWDSSNNMPIFRRGTTATHPNLDYEGRQEFMIDAACFPGSSGSPVFLYNVGGWTTRDGSMVMGGSRIKLLGVLYAGPQHTATGEVRIVTVPTAERAVAISGIPNNLGIVIKSARLREFDSELERLVQPAV